MISAKSLASATLGCDLFYHPDTDVSIAGSQLIKHQPLNSLDNTSTIIFELTSPVHWIDLSQTWIHWKLQLLNADGVGLSDQPGATPDAPKPVQKVALTNYAFASLINKLKLYLNGVLVENLVDFPFTAFITALLNSQGDAKRTQLEMAGMYPMDEKENSADAPYFKAMQERCEKGKVVELLGRLNFGIFQNRRFLPPNLNIRVELDLSVPEFYMMQYGATVHDVRTKFLQCVLYSKKVQLLPSIEHSLTVGLAKQPFVYPYKKLKTVTLPIGGGVTEWQQVIHRNRIPDRVFTVLVSTEVYRGRTGNTPFAFQHHAVTSASLRCLDNEVPSNSLSESVNFDKGEYALFYMRLMRALGLTPSDSLADLNYSTYPLFGAIFAFDCRHQHETWPVANYGDITLSLRFAKDVRSGGLMCINVLEISETLYLDAHHNPTIETV